MTTKNIILNEMFESTGKLAKQVGNGIGILKFIIEWLENPETRILPVETIIKLSKETLVKMEKD